MKPPRFAYHRAGTLEEAIELGARFDGSAKFMAGGQSLMPVMSLRMMTAEHVIDISGIAALRECRAAGERELIGAGTTHAMLEDGKVPDPARGYLRHVAAGIGYRSIRNRGTVGGSLAHADPAGDWPSALLALDAVAVIAGPGGERRVPLREFQLGLMETCLAGPELLTGVLVPRLSERARWAYRKFCRKVGEFAHSIGAVVLDPTLRICNVVVGAVGGKPVRLEQTSARIAEGAPRKDPRELAALVAQDLAGATGLDPSSYEFQVHHAIVSRALTQALSA
ncbi:MAG TPA: FAD binding domain-containing protein [Burkholderiales bacterium]|nr:FAD binding domain-containing protein [Burkholderiales bacterium]